MELKAETRRKTGNAILDSITGQELDRLFEALEPYEMEIGEILIAEEEGGSWSYFPVDGVISFVRGFSDGSAVEVGLIGSEGMAGVHAFLGAKWEPTRAVVQSAGKCIRIRADRLRGEFDRCGTFQRLLLRFTHSLLVQVSITAACNQLHGVEQRLARWLLAMNDRIESSEIPLSHEFLAQMLGVGRARVTEALGRFRERGGIGTARGRISVKDGMVLEASACECYREIRSLNR